MGFFDSLSKIFNVICEKESVIKVNNKTYKGTNLEIVAGGRIIIDGVEQKGDGIEKEQEIHVEIHGDVSTLDLKSGKITANNVGNIDAKQTSVQCQNVSGNIQIKQGNVSCKDIGGNVEINMGNVHCANISGKATVQMGSVH